MAIKYDYAESVDKCLLDFVYTISESYSWVEYAAFKQQ